MSKPKFRRSNQSQRTKARRLRDMWYAERVREGTATFYGDGQKAHIPINDPVKRNPTAKQQPWDKPLTARGTETRSALRGGDTRVVNIDGVDVVDQTPRGVGADPFAAYGHFRHDDYMRYVRNCMASVMACSLEAHRALEMEAAGWDLKEIAEELKTSQMMAQSLIDDGLIAIQMFQALRKPKRLSDEDSLELTVSVKGEDRGYELATELRCLDGVTVYVGLT